MSIAFSSSTATAVGLVKHGDMGSVFDAATALSFVWWMRQYGTIEDNATFFYRQSSTTNGFALRSQSAPNLISLQIDTAILNYGSFSYAPSTVGSQSTWDHFAAVFNGAATSGNAGRLKMYLNGVEQVLNFVNTIPATITSAAGGTQFIVGNSSSSSTITWEIGHFFIYNRILTSAEIARQMIRRVPLDTTSLMFWAPYDDGVAFADLSPNRFSGTTTAIVSSSAMTVSDGVSGPGVSYGAPVGVVV